MRGQFAAVTSLSAGFAVFAVTTGLVSRAILALMSGHTAAQGGGWEADILMTNPVFQGMYFLMVFVVVSATFLGFALVRAKIQRQRAVIIPEPRELRHPSRAWNEKWQA